MKLFKKIVSTIILGTMMLSLASVPTFAETTEEATQIAFTTVDDMDSINANGAVIAEENGNKFIRITSGAWSAGQWIGAGLGELETVYKSSDASKIVSIEFDFRRTIESGKTNIYLSQMHQTYNGLRILSINDLGRIGICDEGGNGGTHSFSGITGLNTAKWYHYKFVLDWTNKKASAYLTDGDTTYKIEDVNVSGKYPGWWQDSYDTDYAGGNTERPMNNFRVLSWNNNHAGGVDIDNYKVCQIKVKEQLNVKVDKADNNVVVTFNHAVSSISDGTITFKSSTGSNIRYMGSLSADGLRYTMTPVGAVPAGTYTITVPTSITPTDIAVLPLSEAFSGIVTYVDNSLLAFTTVDDMDSINANGAVIAEENGNKFIRITSGAWSAGQWIGAGLGELETVYKSSDASKIVSIEFDFRRTIESGKTNIYLSQMHQTYNGLRILSINDLGRIGICDEGGNGGTHSFSGITGLNTAKWYHYKFVLDWTNKKASAYLTDGDTTYKIEDVNVSGKYPGWWQDSYDTDYAGGNTERPMNNFRVLSWNNNHAGGVDIDNYAVRRVYAAPAVTSDSIKFYEGDNVQNDWSKISPNLSKITVDFGTVMDSATLTNNVYLMNKATGAKVNATGALNSGIYTLTLSGTLAQNTEYTLFIGKDVANIASATLGVDSTYDIKTNIGYVSANAAGLVKGEAVVSALSEIAAGDNVKLNITYSNTTGEAQAFYAIVAYYNGNMLTQVDLVKFDKAANVTSEQISVDYTVPELNGATRAAIMCWDGFSELRPLGTVKEF